MNIMSLIKPALVWIIYSLKLVLCADHHYFVSPTGNDRNDGMSASSPFATVQEAFNTIQAFHGSSSDKHYVELMSGYHELQDTLHVIRNHITMRSYNGAEAHLTGGKRIQSSAFKHVTDQQILAAIPATARPHVRVVHLPDVGITNYGSNANYGFYHTRSAPIEVFYNGQPLRLARWPDEGFINIVGVPDGQNGARFRYSSSVPGTWRHEDDLWVYGFWYWSWADAARKVAHLDTNTQTVTLAEKTQFGLRTGHWNEPDAEYAKQGGYFRFENVLSALDSPGEYYMDRATGNLYIWAQSHNGEINPADMIYVSMVNDCINFQPDVHDVTFSDFTLEGCRRFGIQTVRVHNVQFLNLEVKNTGSLAMALYQDNRDIRIANCYIHDTDGGFELNGGDRPKLESSGIIVEDCEFAGYARTAAVGTHAINARGVGHQMRYNLFYNGQYTAIWYIGNDHVMEFNHIHHVCVNASDCGALHTGRDWTTRGNIIRHNIVHDNLRLVPGADVRGVMLDDQSSSTTITENVFFHNHVHVNIGGGRDNVIENNVMFNATKSSMQFDSRGTTHQFDNELIPRLHAMPYTSALWASRYPKLAAIDSMNKAAPEGNQIHRNLIYNEGNVETANAYGSHYSASWFNVTETGFSVGSSDYFDVHHDDFRVRCFAADWANQVNFQQVVGPGDVGPRSSVGPAYLHRTPAHQTSQPLSSACTTHAPLTSSPVPSFVPDGSRVNDLYPIAATTGCWLKIDNCTDHPGAIGHYEDKWGETNKQAGVNETACLHRAVEQWGYCGSHHDEEIVAVFAPTGAVGVSGDGCYMAQWGCPKHGGPADGHVLTTGKFARDTWAEQHVGAAMSEQKCLERALGQWTWCGASGNHPITSVYRLTGATRTAGGGCWIHVLKCPADPTIKTMFYDAWGAANFHTDDTESACLGRAEYYWRQCGSDSSYPVTANYRPTTATYTYG